MTVWAAIAAVTLVFVLATLWQHRRDPYFVTIVPLGVVNAAVLVSVLIVELRA